MPARPLMLNAPTPMAPITHAQFEPSESEKLAALAKQKVITHGMNKVMPEVNSAIKAATAPFTDAIGLTTPAATTTTGVATGATTGAAGAGVANAAGTGASLATPLGTGLASTTAGATTGAATGLTTGAVTGATGAGAGAGAGLMAAAAPVALPLLAAAGAAKLFGLFNEGGRVPSETMTAMNQQAPQQNMAPTQAGGPLSFKHAEQQQKLALKQATFDADQKRKEEAHRMKMMQQQQKLTEAASGFQTPLSAR